MRTLKIDLTELELAFESAVGMTAWYLDLETGEVIYINEDDRFLLNSIRESYYDEQSQTVDWQAALDNEQIPEWELKSLQKADEVDSDPGDRFIPIPAETSHDGYLDMVAFIATVSNEPLQEHLQRAISGRGAFRRFKDVLFDYPGEREQWFQFKGERLRNRMLNWLEEQDIILLQ